MDYLLNCSSCDKELHVTKKQAGQEITCECGATVQIPTLRGFSELRAAEDSSTVTAASAEKSAWTSWRGPVVALCSLLLLIAFAFTGYSFFEAFRNDMNYTVEEFIADETTRADLWGPDELSTVWDEFRPGLTTREPPIFERYNRYADEQQTKGYIGLGVCGLLGAIVLGVWMTAKSKKA